MVVSFTSTDSGKLYKNTKENYSILESDYLDKTFLIKDTLDNSGWVLSSETKKIGNYTVYKATKTIDVKEDITDKKIRAITLQIYFQTSKTTHQKN